MCPVTPEEPAEAWITAEYEGQIIGFCCKSCLRKFNSNPDYYLAELNVDTSPVGGMDVPSHADNEGEEHPTVHQSEHEHGESDHGEARASILEHESGGHDHATDHGADNAQAMSQAWALLGKLHVLIVHLPIALLPLAGILEMLSLWLKSPRWRFAARLNFVAGATMAIVAASLGWIAASQSHYSGELTETLSLHRWLGVSVAIISAAGLAALVAVKYKPSRSLIVYRTISFALVVLVPATAHLGGSLIYGKDYLF